MFRKRVYVARGRLFTDEEEALIAARYDPETMTMGTLAKEYGCSVGCVKQVMTRQNVAHGYKAFGKHKKRPWQNKFPKEVEEEIISLFLSTNATLNSLSIKYKTSSNVIARILRDEGVDTRMKQGSSIHKDWLKNYKSNLSCERCGFNHYAALQFHHKDPSQKLFNISNQYVSKNSVEAVMAEIAKCEVLCANCHMIEHYSS